ncbi:MAG: TraB/GumN family protein [Caulobacter sp.]|nr:TraB/GumN family protein [Caulobacter sp.]
MRLLKTVSLLAALALSFGTARAAPIEDPEATVVEALVIQAVEPGPAWWRVSDGDSIVYILGAPESPMPPGVTWDKRTVERRLTGANGLLMGSSMTAGLRDLPALLKIRAQLKSKTPLEPGLSPALRERFVAARLRLGQPASRYDGWTPLVAGALVYGDSRARKKGWTYTRAAVTQAAKKRKVKVIPSAQYKAVPFARAAIAGLTPAIHQECLESALEDIETSDARVRASAAGWARGDVAMALTAPRNFDRCLLLLSGGAELWRRQSRDDVAAIGTALKKPGKTVAVIGLRRLLAEDGVLEQLRERGFDVAGPGEALP